MLRATLQFRYPCKGPANRHQIFVVYDVIILFAFIWASGQYFCTLIPAGFLPACPTWARAEMP